MKLDQYTWDPEKDFIAEGAFAEVFRAMDTNTQGRLVALKIYKESVAKGTAGNSNQKKYSLEAEFRKTDGLSHTNIVSYYGQSYISHKDALGRSFSHPVIIMEYATHGTLTQFMKTGPDEQVVAKLINEIILGAGYLHSEGIIHRDLKPSNILITSNRRGEPLAKITDFGISKDVLDQKLVEYSMTEGVGTPHYMAPEQFYKRKYGLNEEITVRTDLWGIGVVIYSMLTGKLPFGGDSKDYEIVREAILETEPDMSGIPVKYHDLVSNCLQKHAVNRPVSALSLLSGIEVGNSRITESERIVPRAEHVAEAPSQHTIRSSSDILEFDGETIQSSRDALPKPDPAKVDNPGSNKMRPLVIGLSAVVLLVVGFFVWQSFQGNKTVGNEGVDKKIIDEKGEPVSDVDKTDTPANKTNQADNPETSGSGSPVTDKNITSVKGYELVKTLSYNAGMVLSVNESVPAFLAGTGRGFASFDLNSLIATKSFNGTTSLSGGAISNGSTAMVATSTEAKGDVLNIHLYDHSSGNLLATIPIAQSSALQHAMDMKFSPDDKLLAVGTSDFTAIINVQSKKVISRLPYGGGLFKDFAFSHDSEYLAIPNGTFIAIYSVSHNEVIRLLPQPAEVSDVAFMPDNRQLAYTSGRYIRIIDSETNEKIQEITFAQSHNTDLDALAVSADGRMLAASGSDVGGRIKIFNVEGELLQNIQAHGGYVNRIVFTKDNGYMISAADGTGINPIRVWKSGDLLDWNLPSLPKRDPRGTRHSSDELTFYNQFGEFIPPMGNFNSFMASGGLGDYQWRSVNRNMRDRIANEQELIDGTYQVKHHNTEIQAVRCSWNSNVALVKLTNRSWGNPKLAVYYLFVNGKDLYRLDGTSTPIHAVNRQVGLQISSEAEAKDYLRFFGFFVRGEEGPFYVFEDSSDPILPQNSTVKTEAEKHARNISLRETTGNSFKFKAIMFYSNAIFEAQMEVKKDGMVSMTDDLAVAVDLPAKIDWVLK